MKKFIAVAILLFAAFVYANTYYYDGVDFDTEVDCYYYDGDSWKPCDSYYYDSGWQTVAESPSCVSDSVVIGTDSGDGTSNIPANYIIFSPFVADASCTIDRLQISFDSFSIISTECRTAIYADSSGDPTGSPLSSGDEQLSTAQTSETLIHTLDGTVSLTQGTTYWLAFDLGHDAHPLNTDSNGTGRYQAWTYSSTGSFPDVSGISNWDHYYAIEGLVQ